MSVIYRHKTLNVLVNNASKQYSCKDLAEIDLDSVEDTFHSNIIQMIAITKYALPHMSKGDAYVSLYRSNYECPSDPIPASSTTPP